MTNRTFRSGTLVAVVVLATALASGAASAQTQIKPGFNLFSTDQDVEIGRQSVIEIERQLPMVNDRSINAYVNAIGSRLAAVAPGAKYPYQFKVVNASDINAFALPGGYMYVNRGLIEAAVNEGQLAGVMAHEMAHVALRHGTNQASKAYLGQTGLGLLGGLIGKDSDSTEKRIASVGGFGLNALFLKFSRTAEEQADITGSQMLAKAGYDPQDMSDFFEVLRSKQSRDPSKVEQFFSSHPAPQDRASRINKEMKLLSIRETSQVGGFKQVKAELAAMPAARSMQQLAQNLAASPPTQASSDSQIVTPSTTFQTYSQRNGNFRVQYPSNWRSYETVDGLGVTLAPDGGFVDVGAADRDLIYGVVIRHYEPFLNDQEEPSGRFAVISSSFRDIDRRNIGRSNLAEATNDLVGMIFRTNPTLKLVPGSQRNDTIDGAAALSLVLSGRSVATGQEERVTVFTRELADDHIVYALFIAPEREYGQLQGTFNRMIDNLQINNDAHR